MAACLLPVRLLAGDPTQLRKKLRADPVWSRARFAEVYVDPADRKRAFIWSGWEDEEQARMVCGAESLDSAIASLEGVARGETGPTILVSPGRAGTREPGASDRLE